MRQMRHVPPGATTTPCTPIRRSLTPWIAGSRHRRYWSAPLSHLLRCRCAYVLPIRRHSPSTHCSQEELLLFLETTRPVCSATAHRQQMFLYRWLMFLDWNVDVSLLQKFVLIRFFVDCKIDRRNWKNKTSTENVMLKRQLTMISWWCFESSDSHSKLTY